MTAMYDAGSIDDIRAMLAAVPDGVIAPDSLTFTRLHDDGGALHTGGGDGIVYAECAVASVVNCPEDRDPAMRLIARAPSALSVALDALDMACQYAVRKREERDEANRLVDHLLERALNFCRDWSDPLNPTLFVSGLGPPIERVIPGHLTAHEYEALKAEIRAEIKSRLIASLANSEGVAHVVE